MPPAMARQYLGRSAEPLTETVAMLRKTGANGALYSPSGSPMSNLESQNAISHAAGKQ